MSIARHKSARNTALEVYDLVIGLLRVVKLLNLSTSEYKTQPPELFMSLNCESKTSKHEDLFKQPSVVVKLHKKTNLTIRTSMIPTSVNRKATSH